jgi:hypothetical protein
MDRSPAVDLLIARGSSDAGEAPTGHVATLGGRLEELGPDRGLFTIGERTRAFRTDTVFGIVLAVDRTGDWHGDWRAAVTLADGSVFSGRVEPSDRTTLHVATSLGFVAAVPLSKVAGIEFQSDRVVYVSDLAPIEQRVEGLLHRPWPVQMDRAVSGTRISVGGRVFDKGIGVHSRTKLAFEILGAYETFAATVGIDDSVRPRGSVIFRVIADGETRFDSEVMTGSDPPRDIVVDVSSVNVLTLVVDFGDDLDVADHADWASARLLMASEEPRAGTPGN